MVVVKHHQQREPSMSDLDLAKNVFQVQVMLAAMFLVGIALGSVLSAHQSEPIQIASME
jgi:uncharacterized membrane protein YciS (DUF1049 family)